MQRLHASTTSFYRRDWSTCGLGLPQGNWNQSSAGTEGPLDIHRVLQPLLSCSKTSASPQKETLHPLSSHSPCPIPSPCNHQSAFSPWLCLLWTLSCEWNPLLCDSWCLASGSSVSWREAGFSSQLAAGPLQGPDSLVWGWSKTVTLNCRHRLSVILITAEDSAPVVLQLAILLIVLNFFWRPFKNDPLAMSALLLRAAQ